jgi:hypothetical protein
MTERVSSISYDRADELGLELSGHDADMVLLDGLTAADSLAKLLGTPKHFTSTITFDGKEYARRVANEDAQDVLFDTGV